MLCLYHAIKLPILTKHRLCFQQYYLQLLRYDKNYLYVFDLQPLPLLSKQLIQEESEEKAKLKQVQETPSDGIDENKKVPINQKHFQEIYSKYLDEELKNNMISLYNSLKDNPIKFPDEFSILLEFENASLEERFRKVMSRFIEFMNGHQIENFQINTTTREVTKEEKSKYLISPEDKYKHLKEKNPELENLQKNLGLSPKD